jgi:hypothetical protein
VTKYGNAPPSNVLYILIESQFSAVAAGIDSAIDLLAIAGTVVDSGDQSDSRPVDEL